MGDVQTHLVTSFVRFLVCPTAGFSPTGFFRQSRPRVFACPDRAWQGRRPRWAALFILHCVIRHDAAIRCECVRASCSCASRLSQPWSNSVNPHVLVVCPLAPFFSAASSATESRTPSLPQGARLDAH